MANVQKSLEDIYKSTEKEYYSGNNVDVFFNNIYVDECTSLGFRTIINSSPVYTYNNEFFNSIAKGNFRIEGRFTVNFVATGYIEKIIQKGDEDKENGTFVPLGKLSKLETGVAKTGANKFDIRNREFLNTAVFDPRATGLTAAEKQEVKTALRDFIWGYSTVEQYQNVDELREFIKDRFFDITMVIGNPNTDSYDVKNIIDAQIVDVSIEMVKDMPIQLVYTFIARKGDVPSSRPNPFDYIQGEVTGIEGSQINPNDVLEAIEEVTKKYVSQNVYDEHIRLRSLVDIDTKSDSKKYTLNSIFNLTEDGKTISPTSMVTFKRGDKNSNLDLKSEGLPYNKEVEIQSITAPYIFSIVSQSTVDNIDKDNRMSILHNFENQELGSITVEKPNNNDIKQVIVDLPDNYDVSDEKTIESIRNNSYATNANTTLFGDSSDEPMYNQMAGYKKFSLLPGLDLISGNPLYIDQIENKYPDQIESYIYDSKMEKSIEFKCENFSESLTPIKLYNTVGDTDITTNIIFDKVINVSSLKSQIYNNDSKYIISVLLSDYSFSNLKNIITKSLIVVQDINIDYLDNSGNQHSDNLGINLLNVDFINLILYDTKLMNVVLNTLDISQYDIQVITRIGFTIKYKSISGLDYISQYIEKDNIYPVKDDLSYTYSSYFLTNKLENNIYGELDSNVFDSILLHSLNISNKYFLCCKLGDTFGILLQSSSNNFTPGNIIYSNELELIGIAISSTSIFLHNVKSSNGLVISNSFENDYFFNNTPISIRTFLLSFNNNFKYFISDVNYTSFLDKVDESIYSNYIKEEADIYIRKFKLSDFIDFKNAIFPNEYSPDIINIKIESITLSDDTILYNKTCGVLIDKNLEYVYIIFNLRNADGNLDSNLASNLRKTILPSVLIDNNIIEAENALYIKHIHFTGKILFIKGSNIESLFISNLLDKDSNLSDVNNYCKSNTFMMSGSYKIIDLLLYDENAIKYGGIELLNSSINPIIYSDYYSGIQINRNKSYILSSGSYINTTTYDILIEEQNIKSIFKNMTSIYKNRFIPISIDFKKNNLDYMLILDNYTLAFSTRNEKTFTIMPSTFVKNIKTNEDIIPSNSIIKPIKPKYVSDNVYISDIDPISKIDSFNIINQDKNYRYFYYEIKPDIIYKAFIDKFGEDKLKQILNSSDNIIKSLISEIINNELKDKLNGDQPFMEQLITRSRPITNNELAAGGPFKKRVDAPSISKEFTNSSKRGNYLTSKDDWKVFLLFDPKAEKSDNYVKLLVKRPKSTAYNDIFELVKGTSIEFISADNTDVLVAGGSKIISAPINIHNGLVNIKDLSKSDSIECNGKTNNIITIGLIRKIRDLLIKKPQYNATMITVKFEGNNTLTQVIIDAIILKIKTYLVDSTYENIINTRFNFESVKTITSLNKIKFEIQ